MHRGWDCHAHTSDCAQYWAALRVRQPVLASLMSTAEVAPLFQELHTKFPTARVALVKMQQRSAASGYHDPHLPGLNVTRLLQWVYARADSAVLLETLIEIGATCVQGDSHRLLMLCAALEESAPYQQNAEMKC